jgi:hypothetical protein
MSTTIGVKVRRRRLSATIGASQRQPTFRSKPHIWPMLPLMLSTRATHGRRQSQMLSAHKTPRFFVKALDLDLYDMCFSMNPTPFLAVVDVLVAHLLGTLSLQSSPSLVLPSLSISLTTMQLSRQHTGLGLEPPSLEPRHQASYVAWTQENLEIMSTLSTSSSSFLWST